MTKTKSQLRAEAVERLRELNCMDVDCYQLLEAVVDDAGEKVGYRVEIRKLIDLLEDEPMDARRDSDGTCPDGDRTPSIEQGDDGVAKLDAQARAEIEDAERSANAAESHGYAPRSVLSADTDTDKGEGAETTETEQNLFGDLFAIWKERKKISLENAEIFDNQSELGHDAENYSPDSREKFESDIDEDAKAAQDTREKLEADIRKYRNEHCETSGRVAEWLDRQAAITQDETIHDYNIAARECGRILQDEIAELKADNDYLRDRNEKLDYEVREWKGEAKTQRNNFEQATEARKQWQRKYETVKAERDELKSKADALEADKASWQSGYHIDRLAKLQAQRDRYRDLLAKAVDEAQAIEKLMEVES